ncbi:MAG: (Fe-S)-binding protein [Gammaproteobacteria bacterium]|nr:(Fe-S)-binding protein [Gammaproteobacteria bacterium]
MNDSPGNSHTHNKISLDSAMHSFALAIGALNAMRIDSCIHCGMCAEACHFYIATEDPMYTPILKAEPFKQAYKREAGPFAPVYRLLGLKRRLTEDQLREWQHLIYDSCNLCGRCSLICPMGIDVAELIFETRRAMAAAGLAPEELQSRADNQLESGQPESGEPYINLIQDIARKYNTDIPMDLAQADVFLCVPRTDILHYPASVAALAKVMHHLGVSFTFYQDALAAENYGYYAGNREIQQKISKRLIDRAIACNAKTLVVPECGHAYSVLRWQAAELHGSALPFKVLHITEFLAHQLESGTLKLGKVDGTSFAFHDPCQLVRKGGVLDAPRVLMNALGLKLEEMANHQGFSFCCAGGGGVYDLEGARDLRYRAQQIKLREVDATGADNFLTSCSDCRLSFADAQQHFDWDKSPQSLLEIVADNLLEE